MRLHKEMLTVGCRQFFRRRGILSDERRPTHVGCCDSATNMTANYSPAVEHSLAALLVLVTCALGFQAAHAVPVYDFTYKGAVDPAASQIAADNECNFRPDVETLCQRCAKLTKSNLVYPLCCENKEEAREWCERYINFGIK